MLATMLKQGVAAVLGLSVAAPTVLPVSPPQVGRAFEDGDGMVSQAACEAVGIRLRDPRQTDSIMATGTRMAMPAPPSVAPPPIA
ncbi:MAG: VWA domain-containing protein, partial [Brevundimonas sp.]|nr:VWA domain-containing protein [Brevundimonas sp.]